MASQSAKLIRAQIDAERFQAVYDRIPGAEKIDLDRTRKAIEFARDPTSHELLIARDATLQSLGAADGLQAIFCQMGWAILGSERNPFITSDHPVLRYTPSRRPHPIYGDGGFFNERVEVSFPLSPTRCLILWHRPGRAGIVDVGREAVFHLNRLWAAFAERYIYSHEKSAGIAALTAKYATSRDGIKVLGRGENGAPVRVVRRLTRE